MLQKQEEEIFHEEIDRDRMVAIEAQDKELAKLLYEKVSFLSLSLSFSFFLYPFYYKVAFFFFLGSRKNPN